MRVLLQIFLALLFARSVAGQSVSTGNFGASRKGTEPKSEAKPAEPRPAARKTYPFHGAFEASASDGGSFTLRGKSKPRRIVVTAETRISRGQNRVELSDAKSGEKVSGSVFRNADGLEQARTVRLGGKEDQDQVAGINR